MEWRGRRGSSNIEDRRGMGTAGAGGIGLVGMLIVLAVGYFFGVDISPLVGGLSQGSQSTVQRELTAEQKQMGEFVSVVLADTEEIWTDVLARQANIQYRKPSLVLFSGAVQSACGGASAAMGPFYCPGDQKVYLDLDFFNTLKRDLGADGEFAQAYVIAHEVAHHVQNLLGITDKVDAMRGRISETQMNALSVRLELQADCLAGVWGHHAHKSRQILENGDIERAMNAAAKIGDDAIQKRSQGYVVPDSFTHGSSAQRVRWFTTGIQTGSVQACDTFNASSL